MQKIYKFLFPEFSPRIGRINALKLSSLMQLVLVLLSFPLLYYAMKAALNSTQEEGIGITALFLILFTLLVIICTYINQFRIGIARLHDIGLSGWWILLTFVQYINFLFVLLLMIFPGTQGINKYGDQTSEPKSEDYWQLFIIWVSIILTAAGYMGYSLEFAKDLLDFKNKYPEYAKSLDSIMIIDNNAFSNSDNTNLNSNSESKNDVDLQENDNSENGKNDQESAIV